MGKGRVARRGSEKDCLHSCKALQGLDQIVILSRIEDINVGPRHFAYVAFSQASQARRIGMEVWAFQATSNPCANETEACLTTHPTFVGFV